MISPKSLVVALSVTLLVSSLTSVAHAKKKNSDDDSKQEETIPAAVVTGLAGEQYIFYGLGGIVVEQTPKPGMWHSNMRSYKISIDGSRIGAGGAGGATGSDGASGIGGGASGTGALGSGALTANFAAANVSSDFMAVAGTAYFVSGSAVCTLPAAGGAAGREILVCNNTDGGAIKYCTAAGELISGQASGTLSNSKPYKIDRFISDGKNWFLE
ncbi:MAG TPA: hypothetical protein V6C97_32325 [Oculatellaceae cyanobacterium]